MTRRLPDPWFATGTWPTSVSIAIAVAIGVLGIALAAHAVSGLSTRYWADDFCTGSIARTSGLAAVVVEWYVGWTGSYSKEFFVSLVVLLGPWAMPLWATMLGGSWLVALAWTGVQLNRLLAGRPFLPVAVLMAEVFLLGYLRLLPNRMESFYWIMGSVSYTLPFVFLTILAGIVLERLASRERAGRIRLAACFGLAFVAAGLTESFMAWQVGVLFLALVASRLPGARLRWPWLTQLLLAAFAGAAIGGLIVAVAPGNLVRTGVTPGPPLALTEVIGRSLSDGLWFIVTGLANPMTLMSGGLAGFLAVLLYKGPRPSPRRLVTAATVVAALAVALVVASYIPPYLAIHRDPPARALTTAVVSLLAAAAAWGCIGGAWVRPLVVERRRGLLSVVSAASFAVAVGACLVAATSVRAELGRQPDLAQFAAAWEARDRELTRAQADGRQSVTVQSIPMFTVALAEPTGDPSFWVNGCIARFYGVDKVVAR